MREEIPAPVTTRILLAFRMHFTTSSKVEKFANLSRGDNFSLLLCIFFDDFGMFCLELFVVLLVFIIMVDQLANENKKNIKMMMGTGYDSS